MPWAGQRGYEQSHGSGFSGKGKYTGKMQGWTNGQEESPANLQHPQKYHSMIAASQIIFSITNCQLTKTQSSIFPVIPIMLAFLFCVPQQKM